jgi:hydrogenase-4 component F
LLIGFGLMSLLVATAFLFGQENYKRMLAYSSVEHMGILAIGVGISGVAAYGALLHMLGASLTKAWLFLAAGNVLIACGTKRTREVAGLLRLLPASGALLVAGLFAMAGAPPFVPFLSEVTMISGVIHSGRGWVAVAMLALQALIFMAMGWSVLGMALGAPSRVPAAAVVGGEDRWRVVPPALLLLLVLGLGLYIPPGLHRALTEAAVALGGGAP